MRKQRPAANLPDFVAWDDFRAKQAEDARTRSDATEAVDPARAAATEALMDAILLSEVVEAPAGERDPSFPPLTPAAG